MRELDQLAVAVANDKHKLEDFIEQHEFFILKSASKTAKRYISKNDDEWSIALAAFSNAIMKYDYTKGSFISFAELMIHRSLIDYYRVQGKYHVEVKVDHIEDDAIVENHDNSLQLEIEAISLVLKHYGFSFMDLSDCSPKAHKTKKACAKAILYLLNQPILLNELRNSKQLPIKNIQKNTMVPQKILERHRKYIIAAAEILHGDYPHLSEYLSYIREEAE